MRGFYSKNDGTSGSCNWLKQRVLSHHVLFLPLAVYSKYALGLVETSVENMNNFGVCPSVILYPGFPHIPVAVAHHEILQRKLKKIINSSSRETLLQVLESPLVGSADLLPLTLEPKSSC